MAWKTVHKGFLTLQKNGRKEIVKKLNAVAWLPFDPIRRVVLLVSQDRDAMIRRSNPRGTIVEVPAGTRDLKTTVKRLVVKESREETGKRITEQQVKLINHGIMLATSPGWETERLYLATVEMDLRSCIRDSSRVYGLKSHGERIRRRVVTFEELERMTFHDLKTAALVWHFQKEQLRKQLRKERKSR